MVFVKIVNRNVVYLVFWHWHKPRNKKVIITITTTTITIIKTRTKTKHNKEGNATTTGRQQLKAKRKNWELLNPPSSLQNATLWVDVPLSAIVSNRQTEALVSVIFFFLVAVSLNTLEKEINHVYCLSHNLFWLWPCTSSKTLEFSRKFNLKTDYVTSNIIPQNFY